MNPIIGKRIKELRKELSMTQAELAKPEMTKSMLSHIENGYANPSVKNLQYIANKLNKSVSYFFKEDENSCRYEDDLPIEEIIETLINIDYLIEKKKYELAKVELKKLLDLYKFHGNSKIYADILFRLATCHINSCEYNEGEKIIEICSKAYIDNELYIDAAKVYMKLLNEPLKKFEYNKCLEILNIAYEIYKKSCSDDNLFIQ